MSNSTFFKLGNGNFVLHGYDTERDLKRAEREVKRALAALAHSQNKEVGGRQPEREFLRAYRVLRKLHLGKRKQCVSVQDPPLLLGGDTAMRLIKWRDKNNENTRRTD